MVNDDVNKHENNLAKASTYKDLANLLGIDEDSLKAYVFNEEYRNYNIFRIPKRHGGFREICVPNDYLNNIQKTLSELLDMLYRPKRCVYGFVTGRNIVDNADNHLNKRFILNIDLKDFFTQIHFGRVLGMLEKKPYSINHDVAVAIARLACHRGHLPQGAPSSPVLSNMVCAPLDHALIELAKKYKCTYTRYADDLTFSTSLRQFAPAIVSIGIDGCLCLGPELSNILKKHSFIVNDEKIHLRSFRERQEVTGLTVNKFSNVRRSYIKELRAMLYTSRKYSLYDAGKLYIAKNKVKPSVKALSAKKDIELWFSRVLKGKIEYIRLVKGERDFTFLKYAEIFNQIIGNDVFDVSLLHKFNNAVNKSVFIFLYDFNGIYVQASAFYLRGKGLITSCHAILDDKIFSVYTAQAYHKAIFKINVSHEVISKNKDIDYVLFKVDSILKDSDTFAIGDSRNLKLWDDVILIGFPDYVPGSTPYIQKCYITSEKEYQGCTLFTVSGRVVHGYSGGVVLNLNYEIIGIIKAGVILVKGDEDDNNINQGFVPIHLVLDDLESKGV